MQVLHLWKNKLNMLFQSVITHKRVGHLVFEVISKNRCLLRSIQAINFIITVFFSSKRVNVHSKHVLAEKKKRYRSGSLKLHYCNSEKATENNFSLCNMLYGETVVIQRIYPEIQDSIN